MWTLSKALCERLHYSLEPEVEFLAEENSAGAPFARLKLIRSVEKFCAIAKTKDTLTRSRFGTTCGLLEGNRGADLLTSYLADFLAKTSASPGKVLDSTGPAPGSGQNSPASLAKWDRVSSSWKIPQLSLFEDSALSSVTWPAWGMMRNGECWARTMPELNTAANESGLWPTATTGGLNGGSNCRKAAKERGCWPTPRASEADKGRGDRPSEMARKSPGLSSVVLLPTPTVHGNHNRKGASPNSGDGLSTAVKNWPTPTSSMATIQDIEQARFSGSSGDRPAYRDIWVTPTVMDAAGFCGKPAVGRTSPNSGRTLTGQALESEGKGPHVKWPTPTTVSGMGGPSLSSWGGAGAREAMAKVVSKKELFGALNPDWVEWLMGWPVGWTSLEPLASAEIRSWETDPGDTGEVPRTCLKIPNRTPRLKAIGNGQVPACAALAFRILAERLKD